MGGTGALAVGVALSPTWMRGDGWRRPDSRVEELFALPLFADLAREAEAVGADFLFQPDAGHLDPTVLDASPGFSTFDSTVLTAALAGITRRIGLVPTVQTGFAEPFTAARQLQSLHRISGDARGGTS
ncbi:hypothetical protein MTP03_31780 [Tsukamurella sp. PLM1]|nr:LLM class flavin-dependent oxidoreductase [Tsukamurella sp. PLM1]BDH58239.1 hypothetical protein MTP03_31780 [Tsukamurella sp. PLM1]